MSDSAALGSLEFAVSAADEHGVPIYPIQVVVVLGHSACGAVAATIRNVDAPPKSAADMGSIGALVKGVAPAYEWLKEDYRKNPKWAPTDDDKITGVSRRNIAGEVETLRKNKIVEAAGNRIKVVGAYYDLVTGEVEFGIDGRTFFALRD